MPVVLKNLAQEFKANPRRIRMILRASPFNPTNGRWSWQPDDPQLSQIRTLLGSILSKEPAASTPKPTKPQRKPSTKTT